MFMKKSSALVAFLVFAVTCLGQAQTLPTGITAVPFYDITKKGLSFKADKQTVSGMFEVPGLPQHFLVLGFYGFVWSLYPDTTKNYAAGAVKDYAKKQLADFNKRVRKGMEQGAHSAAFDPNFRTNRYFYIIYNKYEKESDYHTGVVANQPGDDFKIGKGWYTLERWSLSEDHQTLTMDTTIFIADKGIGHGAASIVFGKDGYLYVAISSYAKNSWDLSEYMRKVLRIDVSKPEGGRLYSIPPSNPFYNSQDPTVKKEIYAYGLRNTYILAPNYITGSILGAEVGQLTWEEINVIKPGKNYGWADGGDGQPKRQGIGVEGPCSNNSESGIAYTHDYNSNSNTGAYMSPYSFKGPQSQNKAMTCADFTNADWSFEHAGKSLSGRKTALEGTPMNCVVLSPAFRGDPSSPFYGHHFVSDVGRGYFLAINESKPGVAQRVGQFPNTSGFNSHNGITSFSEDSYGNLYVTMMHASRVSATSFHDLYRLSGPNLKPLEKPRNQVVPQQTTSIFDSDPLRNSASNWHRVLVKGVSGSQVRIPLGFSGIKVYDLKGKLLWKGELIEREGNRNIALPSSLGEGIYGVRFK